MLLSGCRSSASAVCHLGCAPLGGGERNMRKRNYIALILTMICLGVLAGPIAAQQSMTSATLGGQVEDANGAAISGARLTVIQLERNQSFTLNSDAQGRFRFLYLPVGRYRLSAEAGGFATFEQQLTLTVGQAIEITLKLTVGSVTSKVEVGAEPPLGDAVRTPLSESVLHRAAD